MKRILLLLLLLAVFVTESRDIAAQTVLTDVWKDKGHRIAVKKIAVFWIARVPQNRLLAENEFVRQLKERGLVATPLYVVIPPEKFVERDAAMTKIRDLGVEAILILRMTDKKTVQTTIPAPGQADPSRLSGYYTYAYDAPARDASDTAFLETNLFDVRTEQRIWTARSVTKVDVVDQKALSDFIKIMIDRLALDGMIP